MKENKGATTMVAIFAHPDDEIVVSGVLIRAKNMGMETHLICATRGEACRVKNKEVMNEHNKGQVRTKELQGSCNVMGISTLNFLDLLDSKGTEWDKTYAELRLLDLLNSIKPDIIITLPKDGGNGHPDHKAISALTVSAFEKYNLNNNCRLYFMSPYPKSFFRKLLIIKLLPKKMTEKIVSKVTTDDSNVHAIIKLKNSELKKKFLALENHKSQFPDEKGRYYGLPKAAFKMFSQYECYSDFKRGQKDGYKVLKMIEH